MEIQLNMLQRTVGELVAEDYRLAEVFKKHGIDFCCGGKRTLEDVCQQKGVDASALKLALQHPPVKSEAPSHRFTEWSISFLADYIEQVHHTYVRHTAPQIMQYAAKVARVHGQAHPETIEIAELFTTLQQELMIHMQKEEEVLFPYIRQLANAAITGQTPTAPPFGSASNPIQMMENEHELAGQSMQEIRTLSSNFNTPEGACNTYRVLYKLLEEFESDLHQHVHLENNVLFPKTVKLETLPNIA